MTSLARRLILPAAVAATLLMTTLAYAVDEPFQATMQLNGPITITETAAMAFPATAQPAVGSINVVLAPADAGAAVFDITADASSTLTASVADITMTNGVDLINVGTWTYSGSYGTVDNADSTATLTLDGVPTTLTLNVGATAVVDSTDSAGAYSGTATLTVVYQ